jgi:hypothetical protein
MIDGGAVVPPVPGIAFLVAIVERVEVVVPGRTGPRDGAARRVPRFGAEELLLRIPHVLVVRTRTSRQSRCRVSCVSCVVCRVSCRGP